MEGAEEKRNNKFECRFYEEKLPPEGSFVKVQVKDVTDNLIAIVELLEYGRVEGIITPSEFSRMPKVKNMLKLRKCGRQEICYVMRVDAQGGYIDLSKKRVTPADAKMMEQRYSNSKVIQTIIRTIAEATDTDMQSLYEKIVWPLQRKNLEVHVLQAFTDSLLDFEGIFGDLNIDPNIKTKLEAEIKRRLSPQPVKIRADFELTCFLLEGIDAIKEALFAGEAVGTEDIPIKINLIAPPTYVISTQTLKKTEALENLNNALEVIKKKIKEKGGNLVVKEEPRIIGEKHV